MIYEDTIVAISTAQGTGGISIVRMSGDEAFNIIEKIFKGKKSFKEVKTHTINFGKIIEPKNGEILDEVLVTKMKKPNTFTKEDVIEINCHGSIIVQKKILELIINCGARLAEPGEFTKRAFLNGRIDLSQAEAVIDLINSKTEAGSKSAVDHLQGKLSFIINKIRNKLIEMLAHIEVTVDYPEDDIEEITGEYIYKEALKLIEDINKFLQGYEKGRIIRDGIKIVIVGKPNVGKSSLLNELAGSNRAIVTDIPGTTRDIIDEFININGIPVHVIDTAGIRDTEDVVERIGVEKAKNEIETSDLVLLMIDATTGISLHDYEILENKEDKKVLGIINKIDVASIDKVNEISNEFKNIEVVKISIKEGIGIENLTKSIEEMFFRGDININNEVLVTNIRHKNLMEKALESLKEACFSYEAGMPLDMITIDIKNATEHLGQITGQSVNEDVMKEIFNRFCIGK